MANTPHKTSPKSSRKSKPQISKPRQAAVPTASDAKRFKLPTRKPGKRTTYVLPNIWQLTKVSGLTLWRHKGLFAGIALVYGVLSFIFVQGLTSTTNVEHLKAQFAHSPTGTPSTFGIGLAVFTSLIGSTGTGQGTAELPTQFFLLLMLSLAVIWALRQVLAGTRIRIRDAYYGGMYPAVPFILVLLVIGVQLLPLILGTAIHSAVVTNGVAVYMFEKILWGIVTGLLAAASLYFITSSIFALYVVTLPNMTPLKALRTARDLVRYRRLIVFRKIVLLPVVLLLVGAVIMVPVITLFAAAAQWVFLLLSMIAIVAVHSYLYTLYRELLND